MYDVIIIGSGPAGLSAALYTCRANLTTLVIGKDGGTLERVDKIDNYFGMPGTISGCELVENSRQHARSLGAELKDDEVLGVSWTGNFVVTGKEENYEARSLIFATGSSRKKADIPGLQEHEGKGVSYCAVCDAFFYRGKDVAVLGHSDYAVHELNQLLPVVDSAVLLTNGQEPAAQIPDGAAVETTAVVSIDGDSVVESVTLSDGRKIAVTGVFVALGSAGAVDLAKKIGVQTEGNAIVVDEKMATGIPGLYAAGDCVGGLQQISTAVGEGALAAMSAIAFVRRSKKEK